MSSTRSGGSWCCLAGGLRFRRVFVFVEGVSGFRSSELRALWMSCVLAARRRAVLRDLGSYISKGVEGRGGVVLRRQRRVLFVQLVSL